MFRCSRTFALATVSIVRVTMLWGVLSAHAETMRCQSTNGNLNCAGSSGVSCQTINGKTVCVSGHGGVVQSFGNGHADQSEGMDDMPPPGPHMDAHRHRLPDPSIDPDWPSDGGPTNDNE